MIPGPTPLPAAVRAALGEPVRSHISAENAATMHRVQAGLRALVGGADATVHVFGGAGTLAMEAAVVNHARPGDRVVVVSTGYFGDRFAEIADAFGMEVDAVRSRWGEPVDPAEVAAVVGSGSPPALLAITHVDTSTGVLADVAPLAAIGRDAGAVVVLDGVCATGGVEERMDAWGVDVVVTGAQKALRTPPGLAIVAVGARARERRAELGRIPAFYADLRRWEPVTAEPTRYFSTHATGLLRALEAALDDIAGEGLDACFARHRANAERLRAGMAGLGFEPLTDAAALAPTLSVLAVPAGVDEAGLRARMAAAGVVVAGCLGPFAGRGIRVGHMGAAGQAEVDTVVEAAAAATATAVEGEPRAG